MIVTGMKEFESICLNKLVEWYNINGGELIDLSNVFIVWSCKTLQNYKCLASTTVSGNGTKVKLPSWGGYWYWDAEKETIMMHTKDGKIMDIRETEIVEYTTLSICSDEWIFADKTNCPQLGGETTFDFSDAIKYLKRGLKVARKGWNGKKQYIQLAPI